ncbi:MAG TPA: NlpC/P60 family protein [Gaiellaceae bacterium]|nr:NlpC/P60 family protein [Gaiellaceae bacterium]
MRARRLIPVLLASLVGAALVEASTVSASPGLAAQRLREKTVYAQVAAINARLDGVVQAWDGARVQLGATDARLRENTRQLGAARSNLAAAERRIEQRLVELYTSQNPDGVAVIVGATSISDLIDRIEAEHVLSAQDAAIGRQAELYQAQVTRTENALRTERRARAVTVARLDARRETIARGLDSERRLLASIHQSIQTLEAQQAARERRRAALERAEVARQAALARQEAAAQAVSPASDPTDPSAPSGATPSAPAVPAAPVVPAPGPTPYSAAATIAARYLGVPYVWGGESPAGFDCSGLVSYVYAQLGVSLPHYTVSQWDATEPISVADLEPGDLVFFDGLGHVGIYIGGGQFIHAPHTGTVVQVATLAGYWMSVLDGARRVP